MKNADQPNRNQERSLSPRLSRRRLLQVAGGGVVAAAGVAALYQRIAALSHPIRRHAAPPPQGYPEGQYQTADYGVQAHTDPASAVIVDIPPVWSLMITANLTRPPDLKAQQRLETALRAIEQTYAYAPSGIFALVAYGLPYFRRYIPPSTVATHLPQMADGSGDSVLSDAIRFPTDPATVILEENDVLFHFRSDSLSQLSDVQRALFQHSGTLAGAAVTGLDLSDLFQITSVRTGFIGAGMPRRVATQAKLSIATQIPADAPLFMGFTSTQQQGQAKEAAVRFDGKRDPLLPPLTTAKPGDYFAGGTALHLSHLEEDLASWYALSYPERLARMFQPGAPSQPGRITVNTFWLDPNPTEANAAESGVIGHNAAIQQQSRSQQGQALQLRADCNTLDTFGAAKPTPGVHFLAFTAGSPLFHQGRLAMEASDVAQRYGIPANANGITAFIHATRRQNFLVPPRRARALPLVEMNS